MFLNYIDIKKPKATLKNLIILFYIYMIIEGMLRKWLFPIFNKEIYFLKDFFLIFIYSFALKHNFLFEKKISKFFIFFGVITLFFGSFGYSFNQIEILSFILGSRSYWLFAPLFLIIIHVFDFEDFKKFVKINLYFIFPYYILILLQSYYPFDSIINSGYIYKVQNPERPSAYFTYTTQNTYYFLFLLSCYFSYSISQKFISNKKFFLLIILNFCMMGIIILLKSRASYVFGIAIILYSFYITLFVKQDNILKLKKLIIVLIITPLSFNLNSTLFENQYNFSVERINTDSVRNNNLLKNSPELEIKLFKINFKKNILDFNVEHSTINVYDFCIKNSSICRVINGIYYLSSINSSTKFGEGIGSGSALVTYINKEKKFNLGEAENHRNLKELGYLFGNVFILTKYFLVVFLNFMFFFTNKIKNKLFYFPFLVFVSVAFLIAPITYTTSFISFICWFALGLITTSLDKNKNKII